eukprot:1195060-Prorocentrum_minimum.AAC.8
MQDIQAALAGLLWAAGDKVGAKASCDAIGGTDALKNFVTVEQCGVIIPVCRFVRAKGEYAALGSR